MSTRPCPDCGQPLSTRAAACPSCGRPRNKSGGCLLQALAVLVVIVAGIWWMSTGMLQQANTTMGQIKDQVASDAVKQYNIAADQGDAVQTCVQAGFAAAAFLQAQDSASYNDWKAREKKDCRRAGVRR